MFSFEKDICSLLDEHKLAYIHNNDEHIIKTDELVIKLMPNLSRQINIPLDRVSGKEVYLWEDIFYTRSVQVRSRLKSMLGLNNRLHGRETRVEEITRDEYASFLDAHHLMSPTPAKHRLGLFKNEQLVAVAGFGRACPIDYEGKSYRSHELIRFCNKTDFTVVGGLSKLINHFVHQKNVEHLMTYVDREWSEGNIYQKLGFTLLETTAPQEFYLSPENHRRYRLTELQTAGIDYTNWQKLSNLGNNKFIKIYKQ